MTAVELAQEAVRIADGITADSWAQDKARLTTALLRLRRACGCEGHVWAMYEAEEWLCVLQMCQTHRDFVVSKTREAVHGIAGKVGA